LHIFIYFKKKEKRKKTLQQFSVILIIAFFISYFLRWGTSGDCPRAIALPYVTYCKTMIYITAITLNLMIEILFYQDVIKCSAIALAIALLS
jgi:hypothetical protein